MRWVIAFILNIFWGIAVEAVLDFSYVAVGLLVIGSLVISFRLAPAIAVLMEDFEIDDDFYF
jgi:hypothetical protein